MGICVDLKLLDYVEIGLNLDTAFDLPAWVPNFHDPFLMQLPFLLERPTDTGVGEWSEGESRIRDHSLHISGHCIGNVSSI